MLKIIPFAGPNPEGMQCPVLCSTRYKDNQLGRTKTGANESEICGEDSASFVRPYAIDNREIDCITTEFTCNKIYGPSSVFFRNDGRARASQTLNGGVFKSWCWLADYPHILRSVAICAAAVGIAGRKEGVGHVGHTGRGKGFVYPVL